MWFKYPIKWVVNAFGQGKRLEGFDEGLLYWVQNILPITLKSDVRESSEIATDLSQEWGYNFFRINPKMDLPFDDLGNARHLDKIEKETVKWCTNHPDKMNIIISFLRRVYRLEDRGS